MRRIGEPVESLTPAAAVPGEPTPVPLAFRWRGRRYVVGSVLAHWVETGAWWRRPVEPAPDGTATAAAPAPAVPDPERLLWRVEACRGAQTGIFDLCCEPDLPARWVLRAIHD